MTTVLVATNGSPASDRATERAAELFAGADLLVATAVPGTEVPAASTVRAALDALAVESARSAVAQLCGRLRAPARALLLRGDPVEALCEVAGTASADAIVVGSLGGVGAELARRAPCPVVELGAPSPVLP